MSTANAAAFAGRIPNVRGHVIIGSALAGFAVTSPIRHLLNSILKTGEANLPDLLQVVVRFCECPKVASTILETRTSYPHSPGTVLWASRGSHLNVTVSVCAEGTHKAPNSQGSSLVQQPLPRKRVDDRLGGLPVLNVPPLPHRIVGSQQAHGSTFKRLGVLSLRQPLPPRPSRTIMGLTMSQRPLAADAAGCGQAVMRR